MADLAKETVKKWKNDVAAQKEKPGSTATKATPSQKASSPTLPTPASSGTAIPATTTNGAAKAESIPANGAGGNKVRDANSDGISKHPMDHKVRDGSIVLLYNAICLDSLQCTPPLKLQADA